MVVLDRPQDAVNIGAVVRAIKNMGFSQLRLVNPRPYEPQDLARVAHHAEDIIAAIRIYATLDEALADVGTSLAPPQLHMPLAPCAVTSKRSAGS